MRKRWVDNMRFIVKDMDIATGDVSVVILHEDDAEQLDLHHMDRVVIKKQRKEAIAVVHVGESRKAVRPGYIGLFEEALAAIDAKHNDKISLEFAEKPASVNFIRKTNGNRTQPL